LRYRYGDDPFCPCAPDKVRFLNPVGCQTATSTAGNLTRFGERVEYLYNTDPDVAEESHWL